MASIDDYAGLIEGDQVSHLYVVRLLYKADLALYVIAYQVHEAANHLRGL